MTSQYQSFHNSMMEYTKEQLFVYSDILRTDNVKRSDKKAVIIEELVTYIQNNARDILNYLPLYEIERIQKIINSSKGKIPVNQLNVSKDILSILNLIITETDDIKKVSYNRFHPEFHAAFATAMNGYLAQEENQSRFKMEQSLIGLLNLYGCLDLNEITALYLHFYPDTDKDELFSMLTESYLFPLCSVDFLEEGAPTLYTSPLMHDAPYIVELTDAINYPALYEGFTHAEIEKAGEMPFPIFETAELAPVLAWFRKYKITASNTKALISYFWVHTNERSDLLPVLFSLFQQIEISNAQADKAFAMFNAYFNSAPSWVLKGATELSYIAQFGSDELIRAKEEEINERFNEGIDETAAADEEGATTTELLSRNTCDSSDVNMPMIAAPKVGRNDPCTCGSGRKFKACCGKN